VKKTAVFAIFLCLALALSACTAGGDAIPYDNGGVCEHVFGMWYDVHTATCVSAGEQIRYCKICRESETATVPVPTDEAARAHAFSDTVVPATESTWGHTDRECTLCHYRVEGAFPTPPLYMLTANDTTATTPPAGVDAMLLSDTESHVQHGGVATDRAVSAAPALRFTASLTALTAATASGATVTLDTAFTIEQSLLDALPVGTPRAGFVAGNTVTVATLISAYIATGGADAALALATAVSGSEAGFMALMRTRVAALGLTDTEIVSLLTASGSTTLYDTAVLLARVLDEPLLSDALGAGVGQYVKILGRTPAVWMSADSMRISALASEDGRVYFLLVCGSTLPATVEETLFTPYFS